MENDRELLEAWRKGDKGAGNELFNRHFDALRRFFRSKVDITDVEDLIQRTLLSCLESVARFRGEASFRTYLFVIARRQLCDHIDRRGRHARREAVDLTVRSIRDMGLSPSRIVANQEDHALIAEAMSHIPVDFQITLELYYWEQLKGPELAEVLGISPTTVRTRLHRARGALRERLEALSKQAAMDDAALEKSVAALGKLA